VRERAHAEETLLVGNGTVPTFGLWYDFRQKLPLGDYARFYAEWGTDRDQPRPEPIREEDLPWERYLVGTPEEVFGALIELYQEAPYDHLCFWGRLPGVTHQQALTNMRLFASRVAPRVRDAVKV
jgi:alkanesulfonate monooxygenase SsuD/methylene tetrahydromethanopterin reductase-like flavin-dependent oxidoreductase (luciferase family)